MSATLSLDAVTVTRAARPVLTSIDLTVAPRHRIGLVGPNGVGKSTLLAVCAGELEVDHGHRTIAPPTATVGWLRQEPERDHAETVRVALARRTGVTAAQAELDAAAVSLAEGADGAADRYDIALQRWLALGAADLDARIGETCNELGIDARLLDEVTSTLSGGEAARVGLAGLLMSRFDVYLLDEPTNDLDLDGLKRLENWINGLDAGVMLVSHDRRFLSEVTTEIVEIDQFTHTLTRFGGGWQAYLDERERARRLEWERYDDYDVTRRSLADRAQQQREWAQRGLGRARRSDEPDKNIRAFKIDQTAQLAGKAAQTARAIDRLEHVDKPREPWQLRLTVPDAPRGGDIVARLSGVILERSEFRLGPIDLLVEHGERIALLGNNGAGKSTLIDLILGRVDPTRGTVRLGSGVVIGEIEQVRRQLDDAATLERSFIDATSMTISETRTLLAKFGLVGDHVDRPTASLSPGERTRAALALLMARGANLLVLDEPTNHLDLPAIEHLEQALAVYRSTLIVVSHDREFLEAVDLDREITLDNGQFFVSTLKSGQRRPDT